MTGESKGINRIALDPLKSVVVEAVAGSGKTWLLVSRIVRLLVEGVAPSEILAITFTRKAAQEMATRLRDWLRELAMQDEDRVRELLREREVPESQLDDGIRRARLLYEQFLTAQPPITIATFHSWFLQLLKRAPLEAGALGDVNLVEQTGALVDEAWQRFGSRVQREPDSDLAHALDRLFRGYGLDSTRRLLRNFVVHRAEWWAYTRGQPDPVGWALQRIASEMEDPHGNAAQSAFEDAALKSDLTTFAALLARNTPTDKNLAQAYLSVAAGGNADIWFDAACDLVLKKIDGTIRARKPSAAQAKRLGRDEAVMLSLHESLGARLAVCAQLRANQICYRVNEAALACGVALVEAYQAVKNERQAIDYGDIEWHAYSLVSVGEHAVHMHYKLDARYRHILLDEFQDTNPLQWLTLKSWFAAAAEAQSRPVVFLVGDPK
ncbi:MAG TPA: UvrD-helicase domain-containing protein, partial [Burkholderiales bacterium]|nr:UvrD-helicase domain-containing protein [Burkholderiales bacterium]